MGQSLGLHKISKQDFHNTISDKVNIPKILSLSYESVFIEKTFQGLEYVLKKCVSENEHSLISEISIPQDSISSDDYDETAFDKLSEEELFDYMSNFEGNVFFYLTPSKVRELNNILLRIDKEQFASNFNAEEMNQQQIYPWVWNNDTEEDAACNVTHLTGDFEIVKDFLTRASSEDCYIFCTVG